MLLKQHIKMKWQPAQAANRAAPVRTAGIVSIVQKMEVVVGYANKF